MVANIISLGNSNSYGLPMFRQSIMEECFTPQVKVSADGLTITEDSIIKVKFKQWFNDLNGNEIPELTKSMYYILKDSENWQPVTQFYNNYWRQSIESTRGFGDQIENVLTYLPSDFQDCQVVDVSIFPI